MQSYMSIGEVAKIRNIDVQSLRYYEKLGILIPAYVNSENGYRYYSLEQIMVLDTIILCIDLGIPLKKLKEYVDDSGQLEFERLPKDGRKLAEEKIKKINSGISSIDRTLRHINAQKAFQGREGFYTRYIFERYMINTPCEERLDAKTYEKNLSYLFNVAKENGLHASFPHGIISTYIDGKYQHSKMFVETSPGDSTKIQALSVGNYLCFQELREAHSDPTAVFPREAFDEKQVDIIVTSMSPNTYKYNQVVMEFQLLV
ncbi:MAG: MerR family transcriptional regulator [Clostridiales bacterium]|nr:MerR family transcriptional regulator [Clostridiales bacterium]